MMTNPTSPVAEPRWRPSQDAARLVLMWLGLAITVIGALALGLSFVSVDDAARPYFGNGAWAIPVLMDTTIGVLTFTSIAMELNGLGSASARYGARALVALTVYANVAPQHSLYGRILHGAPPTVWVLVVAIGEGAVRRLVGLSDETRIEGLRKSLWLLRPAATWRIWRQMRIHQIPKYTEALDRDAARAAVVGRLRLNHGRGWRLRAPLAERIALRLQGRDPAGVAQVLTDHQATVMLLAGTAAEPVPDTAAEPGVTATEPPSEDGPNAPRRRTQSRRRKGGRTPAPRRTETELIEAASALNAQALAETGTAVSLRRLKAELRVGQPVAERLRTALAETPAIIPTVPQQPVSEPVPAPLEHANGTALD
jgi:hypothetical protein